MYLLNKYTTWYNNIITQAQKRVNQLGYTENHHIIPKSLGGSNCKSNLVRLTAKEHFVCHLLLPKMVEGAYQRSMQYASYIMIRGIRNKHYTPSSKSYQIVRTNMVNARRGQSSPLLGKPIAEEHKLKISKSLKGKKHLTRSAEHNAKLGQYIRTDEHRLAISNSRKSQTGLQHRSDETKTKMSAWQKGIPKPKLTCEHCKKTISDLNFRRWHGNNCKKMQPII